MIFQDRVTYVKVSGSSLFDINPISGSVYVAGDLGSEANTNYVVTISTDFVNKNVIFHQILVCI